MATGHSLYELCVVLLLPVLQVAEVVDKGPLLEKAPLGQNCDGEHTTSIDKHSICEITPLSWTSLEARLLRPRD